MFASWTDVRIGSSVVIELVRQKAVADAGPSEALPDPPVIFYPRADEFDILIVRREKRLHEIVLGASESNGSSTRLLR